MLNDPLQFFYAQNLAILASVEHGVAIGTNGNHVFNEINLVLLADCRDGDNVEDVDDTFAKE